MQKEIYRHEYKYPINRIQMALEEAKISAVAELDANVGETGYYNIRSLYFDDYYDSGYRDNENGTDNREKYRIRIYNHSAENIKLEMKKKVRGKTQKLSCKITEEQCRLLMEGLIPEDIGSNQQVLRKMAYLMATRLMQPKIIVDYDRVPYVYRIKDANVRITFDMNLTSSENIADFLEERIDGRGIFAVDELLMEVKYDDFLPEEMSSLLQLEGLRASTFSKYYLCRTFKG